MYFSDSQPSHQTHLANLPSDTMERARQIHTMALKYLHREPSRAIELATQAISEAEIIQNKNIVFDAHATLLTAKLLLSRFEDLERDLAHLEQQAHAGHQVARILSLRAMWAQRKGNIMESLSLSFEGLRLYSEHPDQLRSRGAAATHNLLGNLLSQLGDYPGALEHFEKAHAIYSEDGTDDVQLVVANNIGRTHRELHQFELAENTLRKALSHFESQDNSFLLTALLLNLAGVFLDTGRIEEATATFRTALTRAETGNFRRLVGVAMHGLAQAALKNEEPDEAITWFESALSLQTTLGEQLELAESQAGYAALLHRLGRNGEALTIVQTIIGGPTSVQWVRVRADAFHLLYQIHQQNGNFKEALDAHIEYHEQCRAFVTDRTQQRYQALEIRFRTEQLALAQAQAQARVQMMETLAHTDPLTGIPNRRYLEMTLDTALLNIKTAGGKLSVAMMDIDHFKAINDTYSHAVGDIVLRRVANIVTEQLRGEDLVSRIGGEEFLIVLRNTHVEAAQEACERILSAFRNYDWGAITPGLKVTASIGIADTQQLTDRASIVAAADTALYQAKIAGRNRSILWQARRT